MNLLRRLMPAIAAGFLAGVLAGCSTVPISERRQLNFIPSDQELELGLTAFEQMKQEMPVSRDPQANALVQEVGRRIAAAAADDMPEAQWEFVVFESEQANAFCLPGGKIGVHTGILPITQDAEGLATVLGHEVAHAISHHGAERMSEALLMQAGGQALGAALSSSNPTLQLATSIAYGLGAQVGRALPHGRRQELEADESGLILMARAGYNPEAALEFWKRFAEHAGEQRTLWFLSTHPLTEERMEKLREAMPEARAEFLRIAPSR